MTWLDQVKARLKSAKSNLVLGNAQTRTDLDKAIRIIECYERALEQVRDTPGLGGLDFRSEKKWRENSMKVIDQVTNEALAEAEKIKKEAIAKAREGLK